MRATVVIANRSAGSTTDASLGAALVELARRGPVEVVDADADDVDDVIASTDHRLVVAGGDGTLHAVLGRAHARGRLPGLELGLVPLGTGNDLARGAGLPLDPVAAAVAATGPGHRLDLLVVTAGPRAAPTHVVANCAHAGAGAAAALAADQLKPRLGRAAYPLGALRGAWQADPVDAEVTVDGRVVYAGPMALVVVANGPTIGGGTPVAPDARPDDGSADVVVVPAGGVVDTVRLGWALRTGRHLDLPDVVTARGTDVRLQGRPARWNEDGEVGAPVSSWRARVQRGGWSLRGAAPGRP